MKVVFMGTPDFAAESLRRLTDFHDVVLVVTQPDRPSGRGYKLTPPPVKVVAEANNIPVIQPSKVNDLEIIQQLEALEPDVIVVVAFGQKIPKEILTMAPLGCINLHGSLLPKYRGAAPIQRAIINGETVTGLTTMLMDEGWDTGDMLLKCEVEIDIKDTAGSLHDKMMEKGALLLVETLEKLERNEITPEKQDDSLATYAKKMTREDRFVDLNKNALEVYNHLRALLPWPGIKFTHNGKVVSFEAVSLGESTNNGVKPGTVVLVVNDYFEIACLDKTIRFTNIKPEGSRLLNVHEYKNGYNLIEGDLFTPVEG